jgi:hypothetical protein
MPDNKSPRTTCLILASLVLFACGLFVTPNQTPAPIQPSDTAAPRTDTPTQLPPTVTLPPPSPRPTITTTPAPEWMTDFAGPILAHIASRPPDFEDDFEPRSNAWAVADWGADWRMKFESGKMVVTECYMSYQGIKFNDFVVEVTVSWVSGRGDIGIMFRDELCRFWVKPDFGMEAYCQKVVSGKMERTNIILKEYKISGPNLVQLRLIAKGGRFAFYLDGKPMGYFEDEVMNIGRQLTLMVELQDTTGAFDDFKIWNISDLKIP